MTSVAQVAEAEQNDVRTIVFGGLKIGIITAVGVTVFALISRPMNGGVETVVQSILIAAGIGVFSYLPGFWVRVRSTDGIGWATLLGLVGALFFTVFDTAILRPLDLYHWTWDEIGGGSGFWYIPVWWMGSAVLAALGAIGIKAASVGGTMPRLAELVVRPVVLAVVIFGVLVLGNVLPGTSAVVALALSGGLFLEGVWLAAKG